MRHFNNLHLLHGHPQGRRSAPPDIWQDDEWNAKLDNLSNYHLAELYRKLEAKGDQQGGGVDKSVDNAENPQGLSIEEQAKIHHQLREVMRGRGYTRMPSEHRVKIQSARLALESKLPREMTKEKR